MIVFLQLLFRGPEQLLGSVVQWLNQASSVTAAGINLSNYVSWVGLLGPAWVKVINSLLASLTLIGVLFAARAVYRLYLSFKQGIKWW